ncbi:MAG TPA: toll/interleukin-1 receptor domain-containing protein [Longimicrobium sp.]|nr:toll/interleukin-1 receptor domain-containing protein [Longimicrobium sp.]
MSLASPPNDYTYDVFLSYKRGHPVGPWVDMYLYPHLTGWLQDAMGGIEPRIFYDKEVIDTGDRWPDTLRDAIGSSRVLLAVCSPSYFRSPWCLSEWKSFKAREKVISAARLRVPIRHNDGQWYEHEVKEIQMSDFSTLTSVMPAFPNDPKSLLFEEKVQELALSIARAVSAAPPYRSDWPVEVVTQAAVPHVPFVRL